MVDVALRSYLLPPATEPNLNKPYEAHEAISGLKFNKSPARNDFPHRALNHLLQRALTLLAQILHAVLLTHQSLTARKKARVFSILNPGNDPALPSSYRPISLLETIGKVFENVILTRILHEISIAYPRSCPASLKE